MTTGRINQVASHSSNFFREAGQARRAPSHRQTQAHSAPDSSPQSGASLSPHPSTASLHATASPPRHFINLFLHLLLLLMSGWATQTSSMTCKGMAIIDVYSLYIRQTGQATGAASRHRQTQADSAPDSSPQSGTSLARIHQRPTYTRRGQPAPCFSSPPPTPPHHDWSCHHR